MRGVIQRNASMGGPDRRIRSALVLLVGAIVVAPGVALATGAGEGAVAQYKLVLPDAQEYRLRPSDEYALRAPWAKPRLRLPATMDSAALNARLAARPFHEDILAAAKTHGLDSALVHAVIAAESNYQKNAVSPKGAIGLMQVMPETGARYGVLRAKLAKPDTNIGTGTRYLADLLDLFNGNLELALAGYNAGENAVIRHGMRIPPFAETRAYVARVKRLYADLHAR